MNKINIIYFGVINSTSLYLKEHYQELENYSFIVSDEQTHGKGRNDHIWLSAPKKNLLFSFLIKDRLLIDKFNEVSLSVSYVIAKYLRDFFHLETFIKWPNDILVNKHKISGVLLNSTMENNEIVSLIVGVGLNVNEVLFPEIIADFATSIKKETNEEIEIKKISEELFPLIIEYLELVKKGDKSYLVFARNYNYLKNKKVKSSLSFESDIKVIDINDDSSLLALADGKLTSIYSGEISLIKEEEN